ncbi:anti-sigma factor [Actinoplanes sp. RD1]|uniref:anti-sigma factor n=1 Tax=Actinoplanes sp. RD1 TaxID=3064538 RepID=UPI002740F68E|nr:anti-sigma factor [Actinoplanes sp. RD1]
MDPDRLVLLALSEAEPEPGEADHLADCAGCRHERDDLRQVAGLGAQAQDVQDLPPPPEHVWRAIEARIGTVPHRARPRRLAPALAAVAIAVLAVAGTVVVDRLVSRPAAEQVTARATLTPLATVPPSAGGDVTVLAGGRMRVDVRNLPLTTGYHEVWLLDPADPTRMVAVGSLTTAPEVVLPVPPGTDLNRYRLVDISDEPHDGDAAHSGHSLLRGTLTS